ncbi:3305_t:CDS:2 [Gigaspora margarita]|uniref:3305_t:CDS:1 n=1 Tax=Gigaspora margarita TaxID=4874 RepID=A0ABN7UUE1_GIGMA|nr:3305_t:CDS:2 [Gigaspora margarita]
MCQPGARVEDVAELEKILKRPIKLLDITQWTIFNNRMVEYYNDNVWKAINEVLQGPQAIWIIGLGLGEGETLEEIQSISQFVLEDGRTFRTWMKHTDIVKACKELFEDAVNWQFQKGIISEKRKQESLESLKIVELAEQVFGANHAGGKLANEINNWHPTAISVHENIKQSCIEHGYRGCWNAPNYQVENVICIDMKECYPASMRGQGECSPWFKWFGHPTHHLVRVAVNGELPPDDITGFAQVRFFRFVSNIHSAIPVWYGKHFACRSGEGCEKAKGWTPIVLLQYLLEAGILESVTIGEAIISLTKQTKVWLSKNWNISCAIIGKFIQGNKVEEKRLTHRVVIDEGELDFLIQDCIKEGTYAGSDKCPLGHILTYYEGHQSQYTHLRASIEALYKIENISAFFKQVKQKISYPKDSVNTKLVKVFQKTKMPLADWYAHKGFWEVIPDKKPSSNTSIAITKISEPLKEKILSEPIREIQPGQWHDKGEKIYGPDPNVVYWPKNRHWKSIKDITKSTAPSIHDPITRFRVSYLNGDGGSGKTTRAIRIFKDINMVVFTHTNALAKDFQNDRKVKAQTWHSFFRWNGMGEWTPERMGEKKFPRVVIWDEVCTVPRHILEMFIDYLLEQKYQEVLTDYRAKCPRLQELKKKMRRQNNRVQSDLFREALPKPLDRILLAHILFRRIASHKCLELHRKKYSNVLIPLIYRPRDGRKQNCLVQIPGSSEKKELVKNDIEYLLLNTLSDKFLKDILADKKVIDWELRYAMTIHTSQGITLKSPQHVWVIDKNLAWDNLIYLVVGRIEYLSQLIWVEAPPLPPEIAQKIEEEKKKKQLDHELRPSIQEKLIGYLGQDKEKGREFDLTVDYILILKRIQEEKSTNPTPLNIACLEILALNVLKNSSPEKIASDINIPELDPCSLCNQELFLYEIKKPITLLTCGHLYHHNCIKSSIKISPKCLKPGCMEEIESVVETPGSQDIDLMEMSSMIFKSPLFTQSNTSKKCTNDPKLFPDKPSNKKVKQIKKESLTLKKLIEELSTEPSTPQVLVTKKKNANNFVDLYTHAETENEIINREVITSYYLFGKALEDKYDHYKKNNPKRTAQALVNKEIKSQLPNSVSDDLLRKKKERAHKIYELFTEIGVDKIQRIKSITASSISKLSQDEIEAILVHFSQK